MSGPNEFFKNEGSVRYNAGLLKPALAIIQNDRRQPFNNAVYLVINCSGTGEYFATDLPLRIESAVSTPIEPIRAAC